MPKLRRVLHIPDCHAPFHDKTAFAIMLQIAKDFKPDEVVILGDFFDVYSVSRHDKDPLMDFKTWKDEIKEARGCMDQLQEAMKPKKWVFMCGNHEVRLESYINNFAPKMAGLYKTNEVLCLPTDWHFFPYGQGGHYQIGNLTICHGSRAGENPAASMVKKYRSNVLFGHVHKIQEYHISNIHGKDFVGITPGWLGDIRQAGKYIKDVADWSQGFAVTWHKDDGDFYYQIIKIHVDKHGAYSAMFNNTVYVK